MLPEEINIIGRDIKKAWQQTAAKYKELLLNNKYFPQCRSCYCEFPTNFRNSLLYHPFSNMKHHLKLDSYYLKRELRKRAK
jgi:hypothetical protein